MAKKIAILTSGGDAPGMNPTIRALIRAGLDAGDEMYVVYDGFKGLYEGNIEQVDKKFSSGILNRGGTVIRSARFPEFADVEVAKVAAKQLKDRGIDYLVGIGGDGTYHGLASLHKLGVKVIGLPGTIDNDIATSDETIGFNTCLETIVDALEKIKDTSSSHTRCAVVEVMGRLCDDLAINASIAVGAEVTVTHSHNLSEEEIIKRVQAVKDERISHCLVVVSEHLLDVNELASHIEAATGYETKAEVLGRLQRGGVPCAKDRILGSTLAMHAIELINEDKTGRLVGIHNGKPADYDILETVDIKRQVANTDLYKVVDTLGK
ncbi:MAG: 6-phosphofructokinase [Coprobacillus sp.]|nr:6-phosphofructokinase [Coprobacillus sp.]